MVDQCVSCGKRTDVLYRTDNHHVVCAECFERMTNGPPRPGDRVRQPATPPPGMAWQCGWVGALFVVAGVLGLLIDPAAGATGIVGGILIMAVGEIIRQLHRIEQALRDRE